MKNFLRNFGFAELTWHSEKPNNLAFLSFLRNFVSTLGRLL